MSMSVILLVKVVGIACLYRADTQETDAEGNSVVRFKAWTDRDGIDLYWMGRLVEQVYTMGESTEVWYRVSIPDAVESLLKRDLCERVSSQPSPEGRLPV